LKCTHRELLHRQSSSNHSLRCCVAASERLVAFLMIRQLINQKVRREQEQDVDRDQCKLLPPLTRRVTFDDEEENALPAAPTDMGRNHVATGRKRALVSPLRAKPTHRRSSAISFSILAAFNALEIETDDGGKLQQCGPSASFSEHRDDDSKGFRDSGEKIQCTSPRSIEHRGKRPRSCLLIEE